MGDSSSPPVVCKYCGSREEPLTVHGSIICSCGAVLDEVFADASDFTGWGTSSGRNSGTDGQINTWLTVAKKGGKGAEVAAARKVMARKARESEHRAFVRALLGTLTGQAATAHPFLQRVLDTHHQLKLAASQHGFQPPRISGLRWDALDTPEQGRAALAACTYLVFREADQQRDVTRRACYSLQLVASCAGVPMHRASKWFRGISHILPGRVGNIRVDEPVLHVDQIVSFFEQQVSFDPQAASPSRKKLSPASDHQLLLTPHHLKVLSPLTDFDEVRRLARSLTDQLIPMEPLYSAVFGSQKTRVKSGEWAYFMVLWAIGGLLRKRLPGIEWIKRNLIVASLGGPIAPLKKGYEMTSSDTEAEGDTSEDEDLPNLQDVPPSHITQYTDIGQVIAQRAMDLPWVTTLQKGGNRRKKSSGVGGPQTARIKEGTEVQYVKELGDFGISMSKSHFEEDQKEFPRKGKRPLDEGSALLDPPAGAVELASSKPAPTPLQLRTNDSLETAVEYLASLGGGDSAPPNGDASYTSVHHPSLVGESILIDTMSDETIDALLFGPGEMESYLRSQGEIAALSKIKADSGDWKEEATRSDNADVWAVKRRREDWGRGHEGRGVEPYISPLVSASVIHPLHGPTTRRTKADARLLAAATGDMAGFVDRPAGPPRQMSHHDEASASGDSAGA